MTENIGVDNVLKEKSRPPLDDGGHGWDLQGHFPNAPHHTIPLPTIGLGATQRPIFDLAVDYDGRTQRLKRLSNYG